MVAAQEGIEIIYNTKATELLANDKGQITTVVAEGPEGAGGHVMYSGNSIEELAEAIDVPADNLKATVEEYNAAVDIVENHETQTIAGAALESVPAAIMAENNATVAVVSGTTMTSNRIMNAVAQCLEQAAK